MAGDRLPLSELLIALESGSRPKGGVKGIESGVPSLGGEHLDGNGSFRLDRIRYVPREFAASMRRGKIAVGDVLVVKDGATTGKVALVRDSFPHKDAVINEHVFLCRCDERVDPRYVFWYLFSSEGQREILSDFRGAAQGGISQRFVDLVHVPMRAVGEQRRIVAELEKQFSRLDEAVANLKRAKANLKCYRAAVFKAAVEGRLVPTENEISGEEGRTYETGSQALQRELAARRRMARRNYSEPPGPDVLDLPALPLGWTWASVSQVCEVVVDCHNKTAPYVGQGIPLVRTTNVRNGQLVLDDLRFVDTPTYEFWSRRCPPQPGDLLFTREAPMGEAAIIPAGMKLCMGQRMMVMRPSSIVTGPYLLTAISSPVVRALVERLAVGTGVKHLRVGDAERLPIPLPPPAEQSRIVDEIDRRLTIIREVEAELDANFKRALRLRQAVLMDAFRLKSDSF